VISQVERIKKLQ